MSDPIPALAARLDLAPHPEGGWFRRTWTSPAVVMTDAGERPAATCIHYLLSAGERSAWHVVSSDEMWLWHGPGALVVTLGGDGAEPVAGTEVVLGVAGQAQVLVPAGTWQRADPVSSDDVLVSCVVSPGFSFQDWKLAESAG